MLPFLSYLMDKRDCYWDLSNQKLSAQTFAYKLREVFHIANLAKLSDGAPMYPELAGLDQRVTIEVTGETVYARFNKDPVDAAALPRDLSQNHTALASPPTPIRQVSYTLETINALWSKRQGDSVHLPMYLPGPDELIRLYHWGQALTPRALIMPSDNATTLVVEDESILGAEWTPDELETDAPSLPLTP